MTKAITGAAAMQMTEQGKLSLDQPAREILPFLADTKVLLGFDANDMPLTAGTADADHAAQPADPYCRLRLRHLERGDEPVCQDHRPAGGPHRQARSADGAAELRSGRALGVWHQYRHCRADGGGGQRPGPGNLHAAAHLRSAGHGRHQLHPASGVGQPADRGACPAGRRLAAADGHAAGREDGPGVLSRRRRAVFHRVGLSAVPAGADEWRGTGRQPHPEAGDRGADGPEPYGRAGRAAAAEPDPAAVQSCEPVSGHVEEMGAEFPDQHRSRVRPGAVPAAWPGRG